MLHNLFLLFPLHSCKMRDSHLVIYIVQGCNGATKKKLSFATTAVTHCFCGEDFYTDFRSAATITDGIIFSVGVR